MISKTGQIWVKTASTTSSRFERVSCVGIEPNELNAYTKNVGTLNKLTLGILEKFARVSFVFGWWKNFTTTPKHFYFNRNKPRLPPSFLHNKPSNTHIDPCLNQEHNINISGSNHRRPLCQGNNDFVDTSKHN